MRCQRQGVLSTKKTISKGICNAVWMEVSQIGSGQDDTDSQLNTSLDEVLDMLAREVERLQAALEFYRLSEHPQKDELIRWHVREIDVRQDRLEDIKALVLARSGANVH